MVKQIGAVPEPVEVLWHNPEVALANLEVSGKVGCSREPQVVRARPARRKSAAAGCLDIGYFQGLNKNLDVAKASQVPRWRESEVFTPLKRDVLESSQ